MIITMTGQDVREIVMVVGIVVIVVVGLWLRLR